MDAMLLPWKIWVLKKSWPTFLDKVSKQPWIRKRRGQELVKALIGKYMTLAGKIFKYGTDEYANDATNAQGWYYLKILQSLWQVC